MSTIQVEARERIATVTLSNPGKLNALDVKAWQGLARIFSELSADDDLRCIILRGEGGNFAAGADIEEFPDVRFTTEQGIQYHTVTIANALHAVLHCPHPTIAAIEGVCVGGGMELASVCDLRIAHSASRFGIPINRLGFPLAPGEMVGLLQLVGRAVTLEILLEGRVFGAAEAMQKGLLNRIVEDVPDEAWRSAQRIAQGAPLAARMNKQQVRRLSPVAAPLTDTELRAAFAYFESDDHKEGIRTFLAKTKPVFTGK
ncbi:enoyl-CoA hydratase/isomerase family protein [Lacisediminimonas profundi]|uniref:enoyl-CoA hydratase/isomerase family protein n=1 Tax=Lacisediminimonas profundi TaxID=2603856 RepID=UPI00124B5251|nr:enoyl-CoA hydratase-related protein [Lacisediminimonas profundi]